MKVLKIFGYAFLGLCALTGLISGRILSFILFCATIVFISPLRSKIFKKVTFKKGVVGGITTALIFASIITFGGRTSTSTVNEQNEVDDANEATTDIQQIEQDSVKEIEVDEPETVKEETNTIVAAEQTASSISDTEYVYDGITYKIITVDGGDRSGSRQSNVAVDVGYGDRVYWALTNEYGQLIHVIADTVVLQDDNTEPVNSDGRYYDDEANVPGTEWASLDQGHVIADSLGGVSNAYNITPQDSTLNRYGDQAYMEDAIRDFGGCTSFVATITYADTKTQIPSNYHYEYVLNGNVIVEDFPNVNPEESTSQTVVAAESTPKENPTTQAVEEPKQEAAVDNQNVTYILNSKSKKFHKPSCGSLPTTNRVDSTESRDAIISQGYEPCKKCNP